MGFSKTEKVYHCMLDFSPWAEKGSCCRREIKFFTCKNVGKEHIAGKTESFRPWSDCIGQQEQSLCGHTGLCGLACACLDAFRVFVPPISQCGTGVCVMQVSGCLCLGVVCVHMSIALRTPRGRGGPASPSILVSTSLFSKPT